ncbi:PIR Superfamily Protein [Plasmodium ovale curtisi]|uniref:PIR Superfamily Protein n=3 Tax=Plasmodium ovale curtisi TaxID=864141 RepID=A0A1A8W9S1_PLAOA|nr:PIR Superfamily Protein [Plasmodium ovale curtisi]
MVDEIAVLKEIDSLSFDYKLDNINGSCNYCFLCYNKGKNLNNKFSFQLLCHQFVKNIEYIPLSIDLNGKNLKEKRYDDFIYWVHNKINKMNDNISETEFDKIIKELINIWKEVNEKFPSGSVNKEYLYDTSKIKTPLNFDDLKRKKFMSDYCQNFNTLHTKLTLNRPHCKVYYDYFMKSKEAYVDVFDKCYKSGANTDGCPYLCKNDYYNPERILKKLNCKKIGEEEIKKKYIPEEECNAKTDKLESELSQALLHSSNPAFNYSDPRTVFLILFTLWGIFLTFYFLYKVTPFGSLVRNNLLKKKIVRDNFDETVDDESMYDYSGSVNTNMQNVGYNMSYNNDWSPSQ